MCKKEFLSTAQLIFDSNQFMHTINVDNEYFYSDHLINSDYKLMKSSEVRKYAPMRVSQDQKASVDLERVLRKAEKRKNKDHSDTVKPDYRKVGPLRILALPTFEAPNEDHILKSSMHSGKIS